jgi:hypothetical protein
MEGRQITIFRLSGINYIMYFNVINGMEEREEELQRQEGRYTFIFTEVIRVEDG